MTGLTPGSLRRSGLPLWTTFSLVFGLLGAGAALAHHSFAMYDSDHQVKLAGTVTSFEWNNPHVYIALASSDENGETRGYTVECASPGILNRVGWKFNMIKPGDKIIVVIAPLKTGEAGGLLKQLTLADGRVFSNGGPAGKSSIK